MAVVAIREDVDIGVAAFSLEGEGNSSESTAQALQEVRNRELLSAYKKLGYNSARQGADLEPDVVAKSPGDIERQTEQCETVEGRQLIEENRWSLIERPRSSVHPLQDNVHEVNHHGAPSTSQTQEKTRYKNTLPCTSIIS